MLLGFFVVLARVLIDLKSQVIAYINGLFLRRVLTRHCDLTLVSFVLLVLLFNIVNLQAETLGNLYHFLTALIDRGFLLATADLQRQGHTVLSLVTFTCRIAN